MRIIVADDSAIIVSILQHFFEHDEEITIAGVARNGQAAVDLARSLNPDAVIMDIKMPVMDGLTATKIIASETGVPVLMFSGEITPENSFAAYQAGAVEVLAKPDMDRLNDKEFIDYFRGLILGLKKNRNLRPKDGKLPEEIHRKISLVVMGASTGGPKTVRQILQNLPGDFPAGIALVQHLEPGFEAGYTQWLNDGTALSVMLVEKKTEIASGHVYVSPAIRHLVVDGDRLDLDDGPRVLNQKPAVDVLFRTAAARFGPSLLGVLLTGMGRDGADGCSEIIKKGGLTVVQDAETSDIFGMPRAAIEQDAASYIVGLPDIPSKLIDICSIGRNR